MGTSIGSRRRVVDGKCPRHRPPLSSPNPLYPAPHYTILTTHWNDIREHFPDQWLVIQASQTCTKGNQRLPKEIAVMELCESGLAAMQRYRALHLRYPGRELYFVHTARATLAIDERRWMGGRA